MEIRFWRPKFPNWLIDGMAPQILVGHLQPNSLIGLLDQLLVTNMEHCFVLCC